MAVAGEDPPLPKAIRVLDAPAITSFTYVPGVMAVEVTLYRISSEGDWVLLHPTRVERSMKAMLLPLPKKLSTSASFVLPS